MQSQRHITIKRNRKHRYRTKKLKPPSFLSDLILTTMVFPSIRKVKNTSHVTKIDFKKTFYC